MTIIFIVIITIVFLEQIIFLLIITKIIITIITIVIIQSFPKIGLYSYNYSFYLLPAITS